MKNISFFVLFTLTIFLILPLFAHAGIVPCGTSEYPEPCNFCHLFVGISNIIHFLTYDIALPASVIGFIIGGFFILTAAGSEEKLKKGKSAVTSTVIGLILVFGAWLILDLILGNLIDPGYMTWNVFPDVSQCSYTMNVAGPGPQAPVTCTSFTYSNFGSCQPNNTQTRSVVSALPSGCTGGSPEPLSNQCNYVPLTSTVTTGSGSATLCSYTYSPWQPNICPVSGNQTRNVVSFNPPNCVGAPVLSRPCLTDPFQIIPQSFTIDQSNPAQFLIATFIDSNNNESDVTASVNWVSSDNNIATVNANDIAVPGLQNGTVVITGTYTDPNTGNSYNDTITVVVNTLRYSCINNQCVINQTNTNITQYNNLSACQSACVQNQANQPYLTIVPDIYTLSSNNSYMFCDINGSCFQTGSSFQLKSYYIDSNNNVTDVTNSSDWSSNNPNLVYVLGSGQIIAGSQGANGFTWIKAVYNSYDNISEITVKP